MMPSAPQILPFVSGSPSVVRPIQYLRALAAMMVVWYHSQGQIPRVGDLIGSDAGAAGVDLFFVISGFIMLVTTARTPPSPAAFLLRRIVRVVPLYWLLTGAMLLGASAVPSLFRTLRYSTKTVVLSLFFIPHDSLSFPGNQWPVLVPGWTLNYEMFFYALFAASLLIPARFRLMGLVFALMALVGAGIALSPLSNPVGLVYTSPRLLEFAAGAIIGKLWMSGTLRIAFGWSIIALLAGFSLLLTRDLPFLLGQSPMLGASLMVMGSLHEGLRKSNLSLLLALGDSSYSIYLTHLFTLGVIRALWMKFGPEVDVASAFIYLAISLTACAMAGHFCYRLLEKPLTSALHAWTQRLPGTARPAQFGPRPDSNHA